jgi:hypothetical protein
MDRVEKNRQKKIETIVFDIMADFWIKSSLSNKCEEKKAKKRKRRKKFSNFMPGFFYIGAFTREFVYFRRGFRMALKRISRRNTLLTIDSLNQN